MGYLPNRKILLENIAVLDALSSALERGESVTFAFTPEEFGISHYRLNRLLNSAKVFTEFEGGKYVHLRDSISFKTDPASCTIIALPSKKTIDIQRKTWKQALEGLSPSSNFSMIEFYPSKDFDPRSPEDALTLLKAAREKGWEVHFNTLLVNEEDHDLITLGVSRIEDVPSSGFAALHRNEEP